MSEFDLIRQHFTRATQHTHLGIGDDAALIKPSANMQLAISVDMLVAGTHFFADAAPYQLGWKALAVNLSDMAAMGANPKWATLAIALPAVNQPWLTEFSRGFFACADAFQVDLIGGDTTRGPLTISIQIIGEVPIGQAIERSGAQLDDEIWLSGHLGDAALALAHIQGHLTLTSEAFASCAQALHAPQPRVNLGLALVGLANSAIDISDGLLADLGHILQRSKLGASIYLANIPQSTHVKAALVAAQQKVRQGAASANHGNDQKILSMLLAGGDDYELCFTATAENHNKIMQLSQSLKLPLTCIGHITQGTRLAVHGLNDELLDFKEAGFDHFK